MTVAQPFAAVIFDCDGVVLDSETIWDRCETEFLARRGLGFDLARTKPLITGLGQRDGVLLLQEQYALAGDPDTLVAERLEIIAEMFAREARYTEGFADFFESRIRGRYPTCIATSMPRELFAVADRKLGIAHFFGERIYFPSDVGGRAKPAPDLFLHAAAKLTASPESCLVIEDSPRGLEAARRAGMASIGLATTHESEMLIAAGADWVVESFAEIRLG
jgi:beta-phosphoglucomutase-like phosphatase (HAD superfamily)